MQVGFLLAGRDGTTAALTGVDTELGARCWRDFPPISLRPTQRRR
jgi:hypothetical protein